MYEEFPLAVAGTFLRPLRNEAQRAQVPATILPREAIDSWLRQQLQKARHNAIAAYALEMAGTEFDLDRAIWNLPPKPISSNQSSQEHLMRRGEVHWADLIP